MHRATQLQFQRLPLEAQRATLWRLAWSGLALEQIARLTGLTPEQVRGALHEEMTPVAPNWSQRVPLFAVNA